MNQQGSTKLILLYLASRRPRFLTHHIAQWIVPAKTNDMTVCCSRIEIELDMYESRLIIKVT